MHRTEAPARSPLHRLAALTLSALLALTALAGCTRSQSDQPGVNEDAVPGESTSTATPATDYTNDDPGEEAEDGEESPSVQASPPSTIIAPEPEQPEASEAESEAAEG
jgi:hypothetical protein